MKTIRSFIPLLLMIMFFTRPYAQPQPLSLMGAGGGMVNADNIYLAYSFGEPQSNYHIHTAALLTEGFQQPEQIDLTTGSIEISRPEFFQFYPNPAADYLMLKWSEDWHCKRIRIENYSGQTFIDKIHRNSHEHELLVGHLTPGLYYLRLTNTDNREFIQSFIKI